MQPHGVYHGTSSRFQPIAMIEVAGFAKLPHLASASPSGLLQSTWPPSRAPLPPSPLPRPHAAAACGCGFDALREPPRGPRPQQLLRQQRWQLRLPRPFSPSWPKSFSISSTMNHKGANGQNGQDIETQYMEKQIYPQWWMFSFVVRPLKAKMF